MANKTNEESNKKIGQMLQRARESRNVLQSEMSESSGLTKNHLSAVERGVSKASVDLLLAYCERLKMTPDEILGFDKEQILPELKAVLIGMDYKKQEQILQLLRLISKI